MKRIVWITLIAVSIMMWGCKKKSKLFQNFPFEIIPESNEQSAKGFVFNDKNENSVKDEGEEGVAGVAVSNGTDVVITNKEGFYSLPVSNDAAIFVIKPKDWMTPVNENNLPQFYYLHKPEGYPDTYKFKGVEPTGELPDEINFPLYKATYKSDFKMVVFGDPQPYNIRQVDYVAEDIVRELIGRKDLSFGMTMGDIVGDDLDLFSPLNQAIAQIGIPWYNVLGNHDINYMAPNDILSDETYERVYGPATYAFVYGDVHFIVVDDVIHDSLAGSWKYVGGLRPDQFEFVSNYLKTVSKEDLVVLTMHIPLAMHGETFRQSDQKKLFDLLKEFPHTLSISAHMHTQDNMFFHEHDSHWHQTEPHHHYNVGTTSGSWWTGMKGETDIPHTMMRDGTPNGYSFISFKGTEYVIDWKVAGSPEDHRMNIHVPRGITAFSEEKVILTVNFFNGSEQSELKYKVIGKTGWLPLTRVKKVDPYYALLNQKWKNFDSLKIIETWKNDSFTSKQPVPGYHLPRPAKSTHLWEAELGTIWPAGRYTIEVQAKDRYGRTFTAYQTMRVKAAEKEEE